MSTKEIEPAEKDLRELFLDMLRHDLINPAGAAYTMVEIALGMEQSEEMRKVLSIIKGNLRRMLEMVDNLAALAELDSGEKPRFGREDLLEMLERAAEDMSGAALEKGMELRIEARGSYPAVVTPILYIAFTNLIGNAIKYGPPSSTVRLSIEGAGGWWKVCVADRGRGIPDKDKKEVFNRFQRIESDSDAGTGLGLAIVKRVAELHGGKAWVEDNPGGGSVFCITIPKAA